MGILSTLKKFLLPVFCLLTLASQCPIFAQNLPESQPHKGEKRCYLRWSEIREVVTRYCVYKNFAATKLERNEKSPVLYFLHAFLLSEEQFFQSKYDKVLDQVSGPDNALTVVTVGGGPWSWYSDWKNQNSGKRAYETWFTQEFIPSVESEHQLCDQRKCRSIAGHSMGGWGALKTAFRFPELFSKVAANSPGLAPFNIYESKNRWKDYYKRWNANSTIWNSLLWQMKKVFSTPVEFDQHDVSVLASNVSNSEKILPKIYFDVGANDDYGFQEGHLKLKKMLEEQNIEFKSYWDSDAKHWPTSTMQKALLQFIINAE